MAMKNDIVQLISKHASAGATPEEMLAISALVVGMMVALQDQSTMTIDRAMAIVRANIEMGNQRAVEEAIIGEPQGRA
jgi:hypothetical protein